MTGMSNSGNACGRIRVTLPISVACDLEKFQQALANVAAMLGSVPRCTSTRISFSRTREFVIDPASLQVQEAVAE